MALRDWVGTSRLPATPATTATPDDQTPRVVATVATVATGQSIRNDTDAPRYRWLILEPDANAREVCCLPEMTREELARCYPGARILSLPDSAAEPALQITGTTATNIIPVKARHE